MIAPLLLPDRRGKRGVAVRAAHWAGVPYVAQRWADGPERRSRFRGGAASRVSGDHARLVRPGLEPSL